MTVKGSASLRWNAQQRAFEPARKWKRYFRGSTFRIGQAMPFTIGNVPKYSGTHCGWTVGLPPGVSGVWNATGATCAQLRPFGKLIVARFEPGCGALKSRSWKTMSISYFPEGRPAGSLAGSLMGKKPAGPATTLMRVLPSAWSWYHSVAASFTIG